MPTTASHDTLDDAAFKAQLESFDSSARTTAGGSGRLPERFDPLNKAFPFDGAAAGSARTPPVFHAMHADAATRQNSARNESRPTRDHVARPATARPFTIAIAIVIGLAAGATLATFVFRDRAAQVIAAWTNR